MNCLYNLLFLSFNSFLIFLVTQGRSLSSTVISFFATKFVNVLVKILLKSLTWACTLIFEKVFLPVKIRDNIIYGFMISFAIIPCAPGLRKWIKDVYVFVRVFVHSNWHKIQLYDNFSSVIFIYSSLFSQL